jgi:hypothetical protein
MNVTRATRFTVRSLAPGDDRAIGDLFDATVVLGAGLDRQPAAYDRYRDVCLGWYLGPGRDDAAVAVDLAANVLGYTLVCVDEADAARHSRRASIALARHVTGLALRARLDADSRAFYRSRLRDSVDLVTTRRAPPAPVHAHLNVVPGARTMSVARALVEHIDARCVLAGHDAWYGELNERDGTRLRALERLGAELVSAVPNHTLTELLGEPVRRLTLLRRVPSR